MEIKHVSRFLVVALVVNSLLMVSAIISLTFLRLRVRDYKPPFPVTDAQILDRIGSATYNYLTNYMARAESNENSRVSSSMPRLITADFRVYGALRGDRVILNGAEYGIDDYILIGDEVFLILRIDFDRQRIYLRDANDALVVAVAVVPVSAPRRRERGTAREDAKSAPGEDGTI